MPPTTERLDACRVRIPREGDMLVDGIIYADEALFKDIAGDMCLTQVANVACLPGIQKASMAMPDIHWGYGFPIGGVAAFDAEAGIVSPGGVGYDINCGVCLLKSELTVGEVKPRIKNIIAGLFGRVPSGIGAGGTFPRLTEADYEELLAHGASWAIEKGYGQPEDLHHLESEGMIPRADPQLITDRAKKRGQDQLGTLGSGNHFLEVQYVSEIFDESTAHQLGLFLSQVCVTIHCGSRGLGHQTCEDHLSHMLSASKKYGIKLPDPQLAAAPIQSGEGQDYLSAMAAAANYAFANRQVIAHEVRKVFARILGKSDAALGMGIVYDVCHNIAKFEKHKINGRDKAVCVHRKGATRAFPPHHPETPPAYRETGQPVLIPGDMGRYSYVLVGTAQGYAEAFGSSAHGAGRILSRNQAFKKTKGRNLVSELESKGIIVMAESHRTLGEEAPEAYKDVADVVKVVERAGLAKIVAQLKPMGVVKG